MSADQPLTGDELATIKASVTYVNGVPMHIAGLSARTTLRLVAEIERLRAQEGRVRAIHRPSVPSPPFDSYCLGCWDAGGQDGAPLYPCQTIRALDA